MFLSRSKKLTRDREAGLVFRWRGGLAGNRGGMTLAIFLTLGVFALAFVGLNISARKSKTPQRRVAEIMMVPENDERFGLWVDQKSPFPVRWDPISDQVHLVRVEDELRRALVMESMRETEWRSLPVTEEELFTPSIFKKAEQVLPELTKVERSAQPEVAVELEVTVEVLGEFSKRSPDPLQPFKADIPAGEFGKQFRWFVTVNRKGDVLYLAPVEPGNGDFSILLEKWLRGQRFKPSSEAAQVGELVVRVGRRSDD